MDMLTKVPERKYPEDVEFILEVEQDDTPVRGNALASGDESIDKACEDEILERLARGDVWAWAHVTVKARVRDDDDVGNLARRIVGRDDLSGCSYKSEAEFKTDDVYGDMKAQAFDDLVDRLRCLKHDGDAAFEILNDWGVAV